MVTSKRMLWKGWKAFKKNVEMLVVDGVWNVDCWWGLETVPGCQGRWRIRTLYMGSEAKFKLQTNLPRSQT